VGCGRRSSFRRSTQRYGPFQNDAHRQNNANATISPTVTGEAYNVGHVALLIRRHRIPSFNLIRASACFPLLPRRDWRSPPGLRILVGRPSTGGIYDRPEAARRAKRWWAGSLCTFALCKKESPRFPSRALKVSLDNWMQEGRILPHQSRSGCHADAHDQ